ncbi:ABC transporter substrate-binding protein [Prescottella agglutinans]|uniref:Putative aliphatic sulfonates-binding protein n=1 Tax=Prescottella agglutinans TaxID=1644129 RepID=A0A3S3AX21_9NOCA|nr:ABC transporter substrate-binding protein [Prescottella agglutinans]RVW10538.1 ABC transporter substrate-binding protein [Prescottella agglutinans]
MRRSTRTRFVLTALTAVTALVLTACGSSSASEPSDTAGNAASGVTLRIGDQVKSTQSLLEAAGALDDLDYKIEWSTFEAGPPLLEALGANKIDAGGTGDVPPVFAQANGNSGRIVAVQARTGANDFLLVPANSTASSIADLKGKKIAVTQGSSSHGLVLGLLEHAKLPVSDFQFQFLGPADALSAFTAGQVDAWAVWNPYSTIGKNTAGAKIIADGSEVTTGQSYFSAASEALADPAKSAALADFFGRLARAQVWADAHPEAWVPIFAKLTKLPEDVAAASFDTSKGSYVPIDDQRIAKQQKLIDLFAAAGLLKQAPVAGDWFDARFNEQVQAGAK